MPLDFDGDDGIAADDEGSASYYTSMDSTGWVQDLVGSLGAMAWVSSTYGCGVGLVISFAIAHSYIGKREALVDTFSYYIIVVLVCSTSTLEKWRKILIMK